MKMVKSLLLGTAAGLVAMTGAQAADLPVKAKPVQYVKICSLYGVGFYYIPGTDMCLKIGGWVRAEYAYGTNGSITSGPFAGNANNRATNNSTWRARGYITADARNQTEYGTVRSYIAVGLSTNNVGADSASNQFSANRAFLQWAGFTFGLAQSFYDFYSNSATAYWGDYPSSDTGDTGWQVGAYTAQFGNGFSGTISAEMRRTTQIVGTGALGAAALATTASVSSGTVLPGTTGFPTGGYGGFNVPDIVGNLRVDQAWGSAQIMGALHEVNANYYGATATSANTIFNGGPDTKWGFAVGAGLKLNAPMIGQGDYFQAQANYAQGASRYVIYTPNFNYGFAEGQNQAFGVLSDAVFGGTTPANGTGLNLTTAWGVNAAYEHFWNPQWKTSVYGGYAQIRYGSQANALLCVAEGNGAIGSTAGVGALAAAGCDNDWNTYWIGSRTQWNVTSDFYLGLDIMYQKLQSASLAGGVLTTPVQIANTGANTVSNEDVWEFRFRVHKDFYP
jgi:hypothetical protein